MSDDEASSSDSASPVTSPQAADKIVKASKPKPNHPPTAEMVYEAITNLADRKGSSLQAIKKYMTTTYKVDIERLAPFIKRYLKSAVESETLIQTKGKGASGSFKIPGKMSAAAKAKLAEGKPKVAAAAKDGSPKKTVKKPAAKKTDAAEPKSKKVTSPKRAAVAKKPAGEVKTVKAKVPSPSKVKKAAKGPTDPKVPKPKISASPKAKPTAKKTAAQKN